MRRKLASITGFTLIELLIALSILATILAIVYGSYAASIRTMNDSREMTNIYRAARLALDRMSQDISSAFSSLENEDLNFVGEDGGEGTDILSFTSVSPAIFEDSARGSDVSQVRYYLERDSKDRQWLMREERYLQEDSSLEGRVIEVADEVRALDFRYYDGEGWREEWDSGEEGILPVAVELNLEFEDSRGRMIPFSTLVHIPLSEYQMLALILGGIP